MALLDDVRTYYDRNTPRFERHGRSGRAIHRAVWGPGVRTRDAAVHFVDDKLIEELRRFGSRPLVLDMGCGIGSSLVYLAERLPITGEGITISAAQAERATAWIRAAGLAGVRCRQGNFLALPDDLRNVDLAFSIEAFVHASDARAYFREAARVLRLGGRLVICDDFLTERGAERPTRREEVLLRQFRDGWRLGSLCTPAQADTAGRECGFRLIESSDLTTWAEMRRPRDILIRMLVGLGWGVGFRGGEYWRALCGGNALQLATASGAITYRYLVFERVI